VCGIIVYDITSKKSFENVNGWINELRNKYGDQLCIILVGNKTDLKDLRAISSEEGENQKDKLKITSFLEISALDSAKWKRLLMKS
jgi:GTPase SAR1 family protein